MRGNADPYDFLVRPAYMPRGSLANHVADQFREAIVSLRLRPGTMLDKSAICARLGISRSPVAEAMARLKSEGLIEILPQRGTVVSLVSIGDVEESIFVRKGLECETVRTLAESIPDGLLDALKDNLERQRHTVAALDTVRFHPLDLEFHALIIDAVGHGRMKAMVESARNNLNRARQLTNSQRRVATGVKEHTQIVEALEDRDANRAAAIMRTHLEGVLTEVYQLARDCPHLFADGIIAFPAIEPSGSGGKV